MPSISSRQRRLLLIASAYMVNVFGVATQLYSSSLYWKQPYHTSKLSGAEWVNELIHGHFDRMWTELGVRVHVFLALVHELRITCGLGDSRHVGLNEQVAIFLYMCVTGLHVRHVAERFQRSRDTVSKYFRHILHHVSSGPFYKKFVQLPRADDPVSDYIRSNPKLAGYFDNALGAMDGTHINAFPSAADRQACRNRKGGITQNCLACVSFDMRFLYFISGWEGSAADATMYSESRLRDLHIPDGKYYLADAGFGICDTLLVPYRGVRYHLAEWGRANVRPANKEELFNLRHAQARNVVERIFGVLKKKWRILVCPSEFDMKYQVQIPPALAAIHNFILIHDSSDIDNFITGIDELDLDPVPGAALDNEFGILADSVVGRVEKERATALRDEIAQKMWDDYQNILRSRGLI